MSRKSDTISGNNDAERFSKGATVAVNYRTATEILPQILFQDGEIGILHLTDHCAELYLRGLATARGGVGAGPTAHFLIADFVQVDLFLNFAVLSNGRFTTGLLVWVNKVF